VRGNDSEGREKTLACLADLNRLITRSRKPGWLMRILGAVVLIFTLAVLNASSNSALAAL